MYTQEQHLEDKIRILERYISKAVKSKNPNVKLVATKALYNIVCTEYNNTPINSPEESRLLKDMRLLDNLKYNLKNNQNTL